MSEPTQSEAPFTKKRAPTLYFIIVIKLLKGLLFVALALVAYTLSDNNLPDVLKSLLQFFHLDPERTLLLAVLQDAVVCFQEFLFASSKKKQALFVEAEEWILDEDKSYLYSFENVCEMLGFEPSYLRQGLLRWKDTALEARGNKNDQDRMAS